MTAGPDATRAWHADRQKVRRWHLAQWIEQTKQLEAAEAGITRDLGWRSDAVSRNARLRDALGLEPAAPSLPAPSVFDSEAFRALASSESRSGAGFSPIDPDRPRFDFRPAVSSEPPLVSIITPFFDPGERFLLTAASVRAQSLASWEWIVVDDASTDARSVELLAAVAAEEPRLRTLRRVENGGPGAARNEAMALARTDYFLLLDADDLLEPTAAEKWLWYLETHPEAGFVNGHTICFGATSAVWTTGFEQHAEFLERNFVGGRGMVRRSAVEAAGGYDPQLPLALEDWDFWLRCADAGIWGATLPEGLDWQHRRGTDAEQWPDWDGGSREAAARERIRSLHPSLNPETFPTLRHRWPQPFESVVVGPPIANPIAKSSPRLLLLAAWTDIGGTDAFNLDLLDQLSARGWEATVATTLPSLDRWREEYLRRTPDLFLLHRFLRPADFPRFLRYLVESRRPDVVLVSHSELGYQLVPSLRAWCPGPAYVDYLHIVEPEWKSGGYPRFSLLAQPDLDRTIVSSLQVAHWLIERGTEPERIGVVYTGVDADRFRPDAERRALMRRELELAEATPIVLVVGRLCDQKRPLFAMRVFKELADRGVEFVALVAGDGEEREAVESFVARNGLERRVRLLGAQSNDEVADLMAASDVFFLPSEREGIAVTLYEAMASGLAVLASDVGGQRELVTAGCGVLVEPGHGHEKLEAWTAELRALLEDAALRDKLGRAARERAAKEFALNAMGSAIAAELSIAVAAASEPSRTRPIDRRLADRWGEQVVELQRLTALCDRLWSERDRGLVPSRRRATAAAAWLERNLGPAYGWATRRGWRWPVRLREIVARGLGFDDATS